MRPRPLVTSRHGSAINLLGLAAASLTTVRSLPQAARTLRGTTTAGLPQHALAFSAVTLAAWALYGLHAALWPLAVSSAACALGYTAVVIRAALLDRRAVQLLPAAGWVVLLAATAVVASPDALPLVLLAAPVIAATATVRKVVTSGDLSGIAAGTYAIDLLEGLLWIAYALSIPHLLLATNSLLYILADLVVLARVFAWRRGRTQTPAVPPLAEEHVAVEPA